MDDSISKLFLEPPLWPGELSLFYKYLDRSKIYFEYGSGGSTHQAVKRNLQIYTVEVHQSWIWQLKKEFKEIKTKIQKNSTENVDTFSFNITYFVVDLQSNINNTYSDCVKYTKIYKHNLYHADFIYIDGKFKIATLMNLFNEVDLNTIIFVHSFIQEKCIKTVEQYYNVIDKSDTSYVLKKKSNIKSIPKNILHNFTNENIIKQNSNQRILSSLHSNFTDIVDNYRYSNNSQIIKPMFNKIWLCWWQGIENMPDLAKICFESIRKNFHIGKITIITMNNYNKYVTIPLHIINKFLSKNITLVNFSDVLRVFLLSQKGGIWLDATVFAINEITPDIFKYSFYTAHSLNNFPISYGRWKMFIQGSHINCPVTMFVSEVFSEYLKKFDHFFSYFMIDYLYLFGYEFIPSIRRIIDEVPVNNLYIYRLFDKLNKPYSDQLFDFIKSDGMFMKLSLKTKVIDNLPNGTLTVYGKMKNKYLK